jgi:transcriptional regulator with XRE-family HTH domain
MREAAHLTQEDAGKRIDLSHQWISEVEGGLLDPPLSKIAALAQELGASLDLRSPVAPEIALDDVLRGDKLLSVDDRTTVLELYLSVRKRRQRQRPEAVASGS